MLVEIEIKVKSCSKMFINCFHNYRKQKELEAAKAAAESGGALSPGGGRGRGVILISS